MDAELPTHQLLNSADRPMKWQNSDSDRLFQGNPLGEVTTRFGADGFSEVVSEGQAIESTFFGVLVVIPATLFVSRPTTDECCSLR